MKTRKLFWGLLLIGGGILLALYALGVGVQNDLFRICASVVLLAISIVSVIRYHFLFFLAPLALITYLWRETLGIADVNVWILLAAAAVLGIGLSVIFRKKWKKGDGCHFVHTKDHDWEKNDEVLNQDEQVDIDENLGEFSKFIHAGNLKRVRIKCNMASMKVYFDQCTVSPEGLEILLKVNLSGVELHIPRSWKIDNQISSSLAEVNGLNGWSHEGDVKVKLAGQVNLAEVKIVRI